MSKPWSEAVSANSVKASIKNWFVSRPQAALGVEIADNCIYMSLVGEKEDGELEILWQDMVCAGQGIEDMALSQEELWELACMKAADYVPEHIICCLVLGEDQVYYYERFFPEMKPGELQQAVRLDFVASSAWQEKFLCSYQALGQGMLRVGGIKARDLDERLKALKGEYVFAQGVLVCHDDKAEQIIKARQDNQEAFRAATYAAICGIRNQGIVFRPYHKYLCQWNWLHLTQALWGAALIVLAVFVGMGLYLQENIDGQVAQGESRLQLLRDIDARERNIYGNRQIIDQKNKLLVQLGQIPCTGQGVLTELGQGMEENIWLTGVKTLEDGTVSIQGRGALYGHISAMLDRLNSCKAGNEEPLILENADMAQDGRIDFRLRGRL